MVPAMLNMSSNEIFITVIAIEIPRKGPYSPIELPPICKFLILSDEQNKLFEIKCSIGNMLCYNAAVKVNKYLCFRTY